MKKINLTRFTLFWLLLGMSQFALAQRESWSDVTAPDGVTPAGSPSFLALIIGFLVLIFFIGIANSREKKGKNKETNWGDSSNPDFLFPNKIILDDYGGRTTTEGLGAQTLFRNPSAVTQIQLNIEIGAVGVACYTYFLAERNECEVRLGNTSIQSLKVGSESTTKIRRFLGELWFQSDSIFCQPNSKDGAWTIQFFMDNTVLYVSESVLKNTVLDLTHGELQKLYDFVQYLKDFPKIDFSKPVKIGKPSVREFSRAVLTEEETRYAKRKLFQNLNLTCYGCKKVRKFSSYEASPMGEGVVKCPDCGVNFEFREFREDSLVNVFYANCPGCKRIIRRDSFSEGAEKDLVKCPHCNMNFQSHRLDPYWRDELSEVKKWRFDGDGLYRDDIYIPIQRLIAHDEPIPGFEVRDPDFPNVCWMRASEIHEDFEEIKKRLIVL